MYGVILLLVVAILSPLITNEATTIEAGDTVILYGRRREVRRADGLPEGARRRRGPGTGRNRCGSDLTAAGRQGMHVGDVLK